MTSMSWRPSSTQEWVGLALAFVTLVLFAHQTVEHRFVCDDAFISFRYAQHLAEGQGLVWNPGERVEGYTNFLWVVSIAIGMLLHIDPIALSLFLGSVAGPSTEADWIAEGELAGELLGSAVASAGGSAASVSAPASASVSPPPCVCMLHASDSPSSTTPKNFPSTLSSLTFAARRDTPSIAWTTAVDTISDDRVRPGRSFGHVAQSPGRLPQVASSLVLPLR